MKSPSGKPTAPTRDIYLDYVAAYEHLKSKGRPNHIVKAGNHALFVLSQAKNHHPSTFDGIELAWHAPLDPNSFTIHRKRK